MLIDPVIVIAQIINFVILVALLKRFLYKPITQAMEARSQRIERELAAAVLMEKNAHQEKQLYLQKQQELEENKQEWLEQAKREVEQEKNQLKQQAQTEVERMRLQWYENLERDKSRYFNELRTRLSHQITLITRKALGDLANTNLEAQMIETFIDRLYNHNLENETNPTTHIVTIRSSFVIKDEQRERLIVAIRDKIAPLAEVKFETAEDIICGIELRDHGYKISWNLEHYLSKLETETAKVLMKNSN